MNPRIKNFVSSRVSCQLSNVKGSPKGFTLLELLIVVSIIAILSVALVLVLDPAETLKKSRDAQRMSDLATMKTALALYVTSTTTPYLGGVASNGTCKDTPTATWTANDKIYYSYTGASIGDANLDMGIATVGGISTTTPSLTDGTGWIPVNFDTLIGGSPISNLPLDPVNTMAAPATAVTSADLVYRYACSASPLAFEINAQLESDTYTTGSNNKKTSDGGNSTAYYEVGTNLKILGAGINNTDY